MLDGNRSGRTGRLVGLAAAVVFAGGGGGSALAQAPGGAAREALEAAHPGVTIVELGDRVEAILGTTTRGPTAREAMEEWMDRYGAIFDAAAFEWASRWGADLSGGRTTFAIQQHVAVDGGGGGIPAHLPLEGGQLRMVVAPLNEEFAVTSVTARVKHPDGPVAAPRITAAQAIAAASEDERTQHLAEWGDAHLIAIEIDLGAGSEVFATWKLVGTEADEPRETLFVYVDAVTAEVVRIESTAIHSNPVTGMVDGKATSDLGPPLSGTVAVTPLPDLIVGFPAAIQRSLKTTVHTSCRRRARV